jgi:hypothetical protein
MVVADSHKPHLPDFVPASPFHTEEHEAFRNTVRRFVDRKIMLHVDQWDEAEEFPRELYRKASAAGRWDCKYEVLPIADSAMGRCPRSGRRGHDASRIQELDPSVGV